MKKDNLENTFGRIEHILREIPFFEDFSSEELDFFSKNVNLRYFPERTELFKQGDFGGYLFFVVEGVVEVRLEAKYSKQVILATFNRGCSIGEMSIVDEYPRSATIVVTEPSELLSLTRGSFESICRESPPVGIKILRAIAKDLSIRLRKTTGKFADLA